MEGFFANGGKRCYIGRITAKDASKASLKLTAGVDNALTGEAIGEGAWGGQIAIKVGTGTFSTTDNPLFKLTVFYWKDALPDPLFDPDAQPTQKPQPTVREDFDNGQFRFS